MEQAHARELSALQDGDPETSHEAAEGISAASISEQKALIMEVLRELVVATDAQIFREVKRREGGRYSEQSVRSRRASLAKAGKVKAVEGRFGTSARGNRARLWELTPTQ